MPIIAAPYRPPAPPYVAPQTGLAGMTWTGTDGNQWDLLDATCSGVLLAPGVRGTNMPPSTRYTTKSPATAGSRFRGSHTDEREVFWPLMVFGPGSGSQAWLDYDAAFWRSLHPELTGVWRVVRPDGQSRSLTLRYTGDGGYTDDNDPSLLGWAMYGLTLVAEQPYWEGAPVTQSWKSSAPSPFLPPTGGPPFSISSGSTFATASISNPGDVDAWPIWTLTGPLTSVSVGVAGHVVTYAVAIPAGQTRTIDTRPDRLTVVDQGGVDRVDDLGQAEFVAVPPGDPSPLTITVVGAGMVSLTLLPLYWRAW